MTGMDLTKLKELVAMVELEPDLGVAMGIATGVVSDDDETVVFVLKLNFPINGDEISLST
jgi:hypothetical protein